MAKEIIIAAIYIRVSTREQAKEGYSLDAQQRLLVDFCKAKKYNIYKIYADEGISAKNLKNRPGMMQLLADAKEKKFNIILVWKLTRFARNLSNLTTSCEELDRYGVDLVSYSESFDSSTPAGRMVRNMLGTVAEFEREVDSENTYLALLERARQGKRTCHDVLGYDSVGKDSFKINPVEAEYVNFVHDQYLIRKNITEVTALAREKGYHGTRGRRPCTQSIYTILTRPIYAGYNLFKGEIYKGNYEPIRTPQQFNRVQRLLTRQGKLAGQQRKHPLYIVPE